MTILIMKIQELYHMQSGNWQEGKGVSAHYYPAAESNGGRKKNSGKKEVCIKRNLEETSPFLDGGGPGVNRKSGKGNSGKEAKLETLSDPALTWPAVVLQSLHLFGGSQSHFSDPPLSC